LVFGGKGYDFGTPSGKTYAFVLTPDIKEALNGAIAPFAGGNTSPAVNQGGPQPSISPLLYLERDSGSASDQSRAVWLQTSLYINTTPAGLETSFNQDSFINIALGGVDPDTGGLIGERRGGSTLELDTCNDGCITREAFAFTGDIASLAGPDGSHFLGKDNPNIVIGFDSTGTHNIGREIPLDPDSIPVQNSSGSTYHVGIGVGTLPPQPQTFSGEFKDYAAGMVQSQIPASDFINVVAGASSDDFAINFDPTANSLSAHLTVRDVQQGDGATSAYHFGFGDSGDSVGIKSAFIDDLHYAAIESGPPHSTTVDISANNSYTNATSTAYLVSGDQLNVRSSSPIPLQRLLQVRGCGPSASTVIL